MSKKRATPDILCKIETMAGIGNWIVKRLRFFGLEWFTLRVP